MGSRFGDQEHSTVSSSAKVANVVSLSAFRNIDPWDLGFMILLLQKCTWEGLEGLSLGGLEASSGGSNPWR